MKKGTRNGHFQDTLKKHWPNTVTCFQVVHLATLLKRDVKVFLPDVKVFFSAFLRIISADVSRFLKHIGKKPSCFLKKKQKKPPLFPVELVIKNSLIDCQS